MKSTFKIFFYLKKTAPRANGCVPIMGRITIDGKFVRFSTKLEISPVPWNRQTQRANIVNGSSAEAANINERLTYITSRMLELYRELQELDLYVTAEKVKNAFMGRDPLSVLSVDCLLTMEHAFRNPAGSVAVRQLPQRLLASAKRFLRRAGL